MTHFGFPGFLFFSPLASSEPWPQEVTRMYFRNLKRSQPLPPRPSRCCNGFFFGLAISNNLLVSLLLWSMWHFKCELFTHYIWFCNILCSCAACVFFRSETSPPWFSADVSICLNWPKSDDTFFYQKRYYVIQSIGCSHRVTSSRSFPGSRHLQGHVPLTAGVIPVSFSRNFSTDFDHPKEFDDQVCHDPKVSNGLW